MNYNYVCNMDTYKYNQTLDASEVVCSTNIIIEWNGVEYQETAQRFVRNKFLTLANQVYLLNAGDSFKELNSQMNEIYSAKEDNNGTYMRVTATARSIRETDNPKTITFTMDNLPTSSSDPLNPDWCTALWGRLESLLYQNPSSNYWHFTTIVMKLHN